MLPGLTGSCTNQVIMSHATLCLKVLLAAGTLSIPLLTRTSKQPPHTPGPAKLADPAHPIRLRAGKTSRAAAPLIYTVTATGYEAVPGQTDDEPFITADNSRIRPHYTSRKRWMALSRDLLQQWGGAFRYGDRVRISGLSPALDGVYTVHDTMNRRHRHCLDILVHPSEKLDIFQKGVKISLVAPSDRSYRQQAAATAPARRPAPLATRGRAKSHRFGRPRVSPWKVTDYPATAFQLTPR